MTFARVYGTGSGALRFRLSVEGWPYEFVTNADMVTTALRGMLANDQALRTTAIDLLRSR